MRRQTPIPHLLYSYLYPHPSANDPTSFSAHLARNLVPEVRVEVATFYGDLNSAEARYPGLNYCHPPHRMRLGRFKHHKRLFDAFDNLGLTYNEIQDFCCWEGTKWARERYEKDEGVKVVDTTGDEIAPYIDRREVVDGEEQNMDDGRRCSITRKTDISVVVEDADAPSFASSSRPQLLPQDEEMSGDDGPSEDPDHMISRMRAQLREAQNRRQRRRHSMQHRESELNNWLVTAWNQGQELPPEIEQFLKEQTERGVNVDPTDIAHLSRYLASRRTPAQRYNNNSENGSAAVGVSSNIPAAPA